MRFNTLKLFLENIGATEADLSSSLYCIDLDKIGNADYGIATLSINPENFQTFTGISEYIIKQRVGIDYNGSIRDATFSRISALMIGALEQICMLQRLDDD